MAIKAIIPAAGTGKRVGGLVPKQYLLLAGTPILVHTLRRFQTSPLIDEIVLVVAKEEAARVEGEMLAGQALPKVKRVVEGGKERQDSVANGLRSIWDTTDGDDIVIVHDGARPFVSDDGINTCISVAQKKGACVMGLALNETIKRADEKCTVLETIPSQGLWIAQTPQAFRASILKEAFVRAGKEGFYGTDEASIVERLPWPVAMIPGSLWNIKITFPDDLHLAEQIHAMRFGV